MEHTLSLLHFNPSFGFKDIMGIEWSIIGNPQIDTTNYKMGGGLYLDGNSNYLLGPRGSISLSIPEFTIDWYEYLNDGRYGDSVFALTSNPGDENKSVLAGWSETWGRVFSVNNNALFQRMGDKILNQWTHYALVKLDDIYLAFQNGKLITKYSYAPMPVSYYDLPVIGTSFQFQPFYGYISELRISNIARWTENFIPHTKPYYYNKNIYEDIDNNIYGI